MRGDYSVSAGVSVYCVDMSSLCIEKILRCVSRVVCIIERQLSDTAC